MKKYRILERENEFMPQYRGPFFFWYNLSDSGYRSLAYAKDRIARDIAYDKTVIHPYP